MEETERRLLLELSQFILSRKTVEIRTELYEFLVSTSIYTYVEGSAPNKNNIMKTIQITYGLKVPDSLIDSALQSLATKGEIIPQTGPSGTTYILTYTYLHIIKRLR